MARRGSGGRGGGAGGGVALLLGAPWIVGYFVPWAIAAVSLLLVSCLVAAMASPRARARLNGTGRVGVFVFFWLVGGVVHGTSLRADSDREDAARAARFAELEAVASRERAEAERARQAEEDARQALIAGEQARPLADRVGEVGVLLAGVGRGARVPRAALCYGLALSRYVGFVELPSDLRHVFDRTLSTRRAQELSRLRREAEEDRGVICRDGDLGGCDCHGSHQGCCSHHGGVARCEDVRSVSITCPDDGRLAEAYLIEAGRLRETRR